MLEARGVKAAFVAAILAARDRARELGDEFGASPILRSGQRGSRRELQA